MKVDKCLVLFFFVLSFSLAGISAKAEEAAATPTAKKAKAKIDKRMPNAEPMRPPQFVLLAFDGSKDNAFWDESIAVADTIPTMEGARKIRFTYFVNPTYYLAHDNRKTYKTPEVGPGVSCIGYSNSLGDIAPRIARTNYAFDKKHEIGSHANSHCDQSGVDKNNPMYGHPWNEADWTQEFNEFNKLLFGAFEINGVKPVAKSKFSNGFSFQQKDIVGFRAPLLAHTPGLWPTLKKFNFRYDTSKSGPPDYWPQRQTWGGWNFPLGEIKIANATGRQKTVFSMDYNWLYYHSGGASKKGLTAEERARWSKQMLDSYKYYFKKNYFGGRAPVNIGHHFSKWNQGAYWQAMQDFAKFVCNKPEVRCVTYKEYADWLDNLDPQTYQTYRSGHFEKLRDDNTIKDIATMPSAEVRLEWGADAFEAVVAEGDKGRVQTMGWKPTLQVNFDNQNTSRLTREDLMRKYGNDKSVTVRASLMNRSGVEMDWQTFKIDNLGTDNEIVVGPLEEKAVQGEGAEAHSIEE